MHSEIHIKILTPLWTGNLDTGGLDRIHESELIRGLRWWYAAIVRGLGGWACDQTKQGCCYDPHKPLSGLCEVCQLFGATGWTGRFQLSVGEDETQPVWTPAETVRMSPAGKTGNIWDVPAGRVGTFTVRLGGEPTTLQKLLALFHFLERCGNLGPRPQSGYGRFKIERINGDNPGDFTWLTYPPTLQPQNDPSLPDLRTFTFFKLQFQPTKNDWWREVAGCRSATTVNFSQLASHAMFPTTPALKNFLGHGLLWPPGNLAGWFFGVRPDLPGGNEEKISLSWAYQLGGNRWEIDGWFYVPQDRIGQHQTAAIFRTLRPAFEQPRAWLREMGVEGACPAGMRIIPGWQETYSPQQVMRMLRDGG